MEAGRRRDGWGGASTIEGMDGHGTTAATSLAPEEWRTLLDAACTARAGSYSPYSSYPVGAAARTTDGTILTGANVENASLGLTLCAECAVVSQTGSRRWGLLTHVVCVDAAGGVITPCGRCRQLLVEHAAPGCEVLTVAGPVLLAALLPMAFGAADLGAARA